MAWHDAIEVDIEVVMEFFRFLTTEKQIEDDRKAVATKLALRQAFGL